MDTLAKLQRDFQDYVLGKRRHVVSSVRSPNRAQAVARMDVYARAYELRLVEVLRADYPALRALAGHEMFETLARAYIEAHPSRDRNARWFGERLADFLSGSEAFAHHPVLAEMARFEWAIGLAFDAPDENAVSLHELTSIPPDGLPGARFVMHSSVQQLALSWNVPAFWKAVEAEVSPPPLPTRREPATWIVWRPELVTCFRSLEPDEAVVWRDVVGGRNFAFVCGSLATLMEPALVPARAAALLRRWVDERLLSRIS